MHVLIIVSGKHKGRRVELPDREVLIGRDEACLVRMTSAEVSRQHCSLTPTDLGLLVRDRNSQNGTFVNHVRIDREVLLRTGDRLQVGPVLFEVEGPPEESSGVEESVLSWLSEGGDSSASPSTGDTTVVKMPPQLQPPQQQPAVAPSAPETPRYPVFKTVAEEAQDIIREWCERQTTEASPK
ncbi:MAG: FHA domain-containing protein [Planctomycetota bacterium]|nr:FHA domain-containing protein [Planctomycetota bacterium]